MQPYDNYSHYVKNRILSNSTPLDNGCLQYGGVDKLVHKYGLVSITIDKVRKSVPASRALWMAVNKAFDLPTIVNIRHTCSNKRCVNIEHLERVSNYAY